MDPVVAQKPWLSISKETKPLAEHHQRVTGYKEQIQKLSKECDGDYLHSSFTIDLPHQVETGVCDRNLVDYDRK